MSPDRRGDPAAVVPDAEPRSYYGQPVVKQPVWTVEIPWYFFAGGTAGASSVLAAAARAGGHGETARAAERVAALGALASGPLLISDLGRPERFANMLRAFKPTSPMSVGSWVLAVYGPAAVSAALLAATGRMPPLRRVASTAAAATGPVLATYTAVLLADTAVPVWHDARRELPLAFAGGAAQSAGGAAMILVPPAAAGPARRMLVLGAVTREASTIAMERRLAPQVARALREGRAGRFAQAARVCSALGAVLAATTGRRHRPAAAAAGVLGLAGAAFERFAVFRAGFASAADPAATVGPQRRRS